MNLLDFVTLINQSYLEKYNTVLIGGFSEPFYLPAKNNQPAQIQFTHDYFRSALHELAHWCVAGEERRKLEDYGYWYAPDGRTQEQQEWFFTCEIVPQAFEWALSLACGVKFDVSVDNLNNATSGAPEFKQAVHERLLSYLQNDFPARTEALLQLIYQNRITNPQNLYCYLSEQLMLTSGMGILDHKHC
jgi:elongation factor P hydroxylase